jgi:hypothetical protein
MREVQSLHRAPTSEVQLGETRVGWGIPQRFIVTGLTVIFLAATAAVILYIQFPAHFSRLPSADAVRQRVKAMSTLSTIVFFHQRILSGIDIREQAGNESRRKMVYLGMGALAVFGTVGLILVGVGLADLARRRRGTGRT